jgi:hypothetical protein
MSVITILKTSQDLPDDVQLFVGDVRLAILKQARTTPLLQITVIHKGETITISDCLQHFRLMQYAANRLFIDSYDEPVVPDGELKLGGDSRISQDDLRDGKLQQMHSVITDPAYVWVPPREVPIPKPRSDGAIDDQALIDGWSTHPYRDGAEKRGLSVPSVESRIQGKILTFLLSEYLEAKGYFDQQVIGFRTGRCIISAMIGLEETIQDTAHVWAVAADLSKFYDTIPVKACVQYVVDAVGIAHDAERRSPEEARFLELICKHMHMTKRKGVPQGSPLSPILANIYAQNTIDNVTRSLHQKQFKWFRYADDILILCHSKQLAVDALKQLEKTASAHQLKVHPKKTVIHNLATQEAYDCRGVRLPDQKLVYLGYEITVKMDRDIQVQYAISHRAIIRLYDALRCRWQSQKAHTEKERLEGIPRAITRSVQVIGGWLAYYGLAYQHTPEDRKQALNTIIRLAGCTPEAVNDHVNAIANSDCWTDRHDHGIRRYMVLHQLEEALSGQTVGRISNWPLPPGHRMPTLIDEESEKKLEAYYPPEVVAYCTKHEIRAIMAQIASALSIADMSVERFQDPKTRKFVM